MKRISEADPKSNPTSNIPSITLADKNNYKICLYTENKDTYRLSLDWSCNTPSISINPQTESSQPTDTLKKKSKHFLIPPAKCQEDTPPFHSAPNSMACGSPSEYQTLPKEEASSDSFDGINGELHDFQQEHLDSPCSPDIINDSDSPTNNSNTPIFLDREITSLKDRVTNIEMRVQSIHTMITEIHEWVQCQKGPVIVESIPAAPNTGNSAGDTPFNNGDPSLLHISNSYSPSSQPVTATSLAGALTFPNFYSPSNSSSQAAYKQGLNEFPSEYEVMELKRRSNTRRNFAAKLAMRIFGEEGLMMNNSSGKCPEGTIGKLDSTKMLLIKTLVFQHWPLLDSEGIGLEDFWKQECLRAIDEKGRYLRFQKKNVYKRMLWKKRTGMSNYAEQSQYGNLSSTLSLMPTNIFSGNGELADTSQNSSATCPITTYSVTLENNP